MKGIVLAAALFMAIGAQAGGKIKSEEKLAKEREFRKANKVKSRLVYKALLEGDIVVDKILFRQEDYDVNGFLIQAIEPQAVDSIRYRYEYDVNGFQTSETIVGLDLFPIITTATYDETGRKIVGSTTAAEVRQSKFVYDKADNLVRQEGYSAYSMEGYDDENWTLANIDSFFYDKTGNVVEEVNYYMGEEIWRLQHQYDSQGRLIKTEGIRSESIELTEAYEYDEKGFLVSRKSTDSDGTINYIYEYSYY
jgi:hypothetical protein